MERVSVEMVLWDGDCAPSVLGSSKSSSRCPLFPVGGVLTESGGSPGLGKAKVQKENPPDGEEVCSGVVDATFENGRSLGCSDCC